MQNSPYNTRHDALIGGVFLYPEHMLEPLNRIYKQVGLGRATVTFLSQLLNGFCRLTSANDTVGFRPGQEPKCNIVNELIRSFTGGLHQRSVQRHFQILEDKGIIKRDLQNGYNRQIDFSPLIEKALEWREMEHAARVDEQERKEAIRLYRRMKHRASTLLQNNGHNKDARGELDALRALFYAAADSDKAKATLSAELANAVQALVDKLQELQDNEEKIATKLSSPPDTIDPHTSTTTPSPSCNEVEKKKGAGALNDAPRHAPAGQQGRPEEEEGASVVDATPDAKTVWRLVLQFAPDLLPALKESRDATEQARFIARVHVPVRPDVLETAILVHGAHTVIAALALAFTKTDFNQEVPPHALRRVRAAYATGILRKSADIGGLPRSQVCNPWPSVWARVKDTTNRARH